MAQKNGAQSVETIAGRKIVFSKGVGQTNIDELKWLTDTVLSNAKSWKSTGWAYIADCSEMKPVSPSEGGELVTMTKKFVEAGCKAFAFVEGKSKSLTPISNGGLILAPPGHITHSASGGVSQHHWYCQPSTKASLLPTVL